MMVDNNTQAPARKTDNVATKDGSSFRPRGDGMSTATARIAIDRRLRKKIMEDYNLMELADKGRYYVAKAYSKDGHWLNELLIDKQTGNIQVANRQHVRTEKER